MHHHPEPLLDRRSGVDRRSPAHPERVGPPGIGSFVIASDVEAWAPFEIGPEVRLSRSIDPWVSVVRRAIGGEEADRSDDSWRWWDADAVWEVAGNRPIGPVRGIDGIAGYHATLRDGSGGTFQQLVHSLDASGGPIVEAHVHTTARRPGRVLDIPTLLTFELLAMRVRRVTETPGDQVAWDEFWAD